MNRRLTAALAAAFCIGPGVAAAQQAGAAAIAAVQPGLAVSVIDDSDDESKVA